MNQKIMVIDEGTTGVRTLIFDRKFNIVGQAYEKIDIDYGEDGRVEQSFDDIYHKTVLTMKRCLADHEILLEDIAAIGMTNQRLTWALWEREHGHLVHPAIVWQDQTGDVTTADPEICSRFPRYAERLVPSSVSLKLERVIANCDAEAQELYKQGELCFGTVDTWLIYQLTGGECFATSSSNLSSIELASVEKGDWDYDLIDALGYPRKMFAEVKNEADCYGYLDEEILGKRIPIYGVVADQQSALFAQGCLEPNTVKCTNGTGSFITANLGQDYYAVKDPSYLRIAWTVDGKPTFMAERFVATTGAVMEWLVHHLRLMDDVKLIDLQSQLVPDNGGVYFIPALTGYAHIKSARAAYMGVSGSTTKNHLIRAALEGVGFSIYNIFNDIRSLTSMEFKSMKISGGLSQSNVLAQQMANLFDLDIIRQKTVEASALGAAEFAALKLGWIEYQDVETICETLSTFEPNERQEQEQKAYKMWLKALERCLDWYEADAV
ncbi:MAG: FGGY family carbohydrate kinase [Eubacteriales bacterium]|nr:FGGY family carbohydrate kinase [Eubacteriales bacterium]